MAVALAGTSLPLSLFLSTPLFLHTRLEVFQTLKTLVMTTMVVMRMVVGVMVVAMKILFSFPLSLFLSVPLFLHTRLEGSQMMLMTMVVTRIMLITLMMNFSLPPVLPEGLSDANYSCILFKSWLPNLHTRYFLRKYFSETLNSAFFS